MAVETLENGAELRQLQRGIQAMRDALDEKDRETRRKVQQAEVASQSEIRTLKNTAQALRDELENERSRSARLVQAEKQAATHSDIPDWAGGRDRAATIATRSLQQRLPQAGFTAWGSRTPETCVPTDTLSA